ncbi:ABC transporter substrate-binding protein [Oricola sp.]|uniref:ABC transporter substrate-binding protein n=1 Tax=Oricola sp. TaxID=1979950 RepID=UPI003BAC9733
MSNSILQDLSRRRFLSHTGGSLAAIAAATISPSFLGKAHAGETLTLMMSQPQVAGARHAAAAFLEATGIAVEVVAVPLDQTYQQIALDQASGANRFDCFDFWYIALGSVAEEGLALDLTDLIERDREMINPDDFVPSVYDAYSLWNGRRYALPFDGDTHALFYNKEILAKHGVTPPKTWDALNAAAQKITEAEAGNGVHGLALMGAPVPILVIATFANRLANFGGSFVDADGRPSLNTEAAYAAAANMADVAPFCTPTPAEVGFTEALNAFIGGKAAMTEGWIDLGVFAQDEANSAIVDKWDVVPLPVGPGVDASRAPLNAGWTLGVSAKTEKQEAAWEFVKFATSAKMGLDLITTTGSGIDPFRISNMNDPAYKAFNEKSQRAASASLNGAVSWPRNPKSTRMLERLTDEIAAMLAGEQSPMQAMDRTQRAWERLMR